jgi:hypothetical protein
MTLVIPYSFTAGTKARAAEVNTNFSVIGQKFGSIDNADVKAGAAIEASKLSGIAGSRITEAQMEDGAVNSRVLYADAGGINGAVGSADHIANGIITAAKLIAGQIAKDKLKLTEVTQAWSIPFGGGLNGQTFARITAAPALPAMAAMLPIRCTVEAFSCGAGGTGYGAGARVFEDATATDYFLQIAGVVLAGNSASGTIRFTYLALT